MVNPELFIRFLRVYAFQPATAFWRAVEVDVLRKFIPSSGHCLDLGCGDGKLTAILFEGTSRRGLTLVGIDGDEDETRQAAQSRSYLRVHTCRASNIPEPSESFDHIFSNSVMEHIQDIEATVAETARLLKPGGSFAFTVPSPDFHRCLHGPVNPFAARDSYLRELDKRLAHYRYWDAQDWQGLLARYGLVIEQQVEYFNCPQVQRWENISRFTAGILYVLAGRRQAPLEIQKKLGLRQVQNKWTLPRWVARLLARTLSTSLIDDPRQTQNACLLILARKELREG